MATEKILRYMTDQNRPYSVTDVLTNLHKEFGKAQVTKSLEALTASKDLVEKTYGKQKIYFLNQNKVPSLDEKELKDLEVTIATRAKEVTTLRDETKNLTTELSSLKSSLTTAEAKTKLVQIEENLEMGKEKLVKLKKLCKDISPEDKAKINNEHTKLVKEWRKRKRMCMDVVNAILEGEGCMKSKRDLLEEMGVDTDEDMNVTVPSA